MRTQPTASNIHNNCMKYSIILHMIARIAILTNTTNSSLSSGPSQYECLYQLSMESLQP